MIRCSWTESLGCSHEPQVLVVPGAGPVAQGGRPLPSQVLGDGRTAVFLEQGLAPGGHLELTDALDTVPGPVWCQSEGPGLVVAGNGMVEIRLRVGSGTSRDADGQHPGPCDGLRRSGGAWHGVCQLDVRSTICEWTGVLEASGPVRLVHVFTARLADGRWWVCRTTLDAGARGVVIDEEGQGALGDEVAWSVPEPTEILQLDGGPAHRSTAPNLEIDQRLTRIWQWSQSSQLRCDGAGVVVADGTVLAALARPRGDWFGGGAEALGLWIRRIDPDRPATRRHVPPELKADGVGPDAIPARGQSRHRPHATWEGSLADCRRSWMLVVSDREAIRPQEDGTLGHFDYQALPAGTAARRQGLLRRLWIHHGLAPLAWQMTLTLAWDDRPESQELPAGLDEHPCLDKPYPVEDPTWVASFLEARVLGLWEGSGAAYSNVVVGRPLLPLMTGLRRQERAGAPRNPLLRARIAFLAALMADPAFYPGELTMRPLGDRAGCEPWFQGMANQNFFTDALAVPGLFAEVWPAHPNAAAWRSWSWAMWQRQLAVHVHPESGLWEESHTYYHHVLATVWEWLVWRRFRGPDDPFADPALARLVGAAVAQASPPDARFGGVRHLVPFGDHAIDPGRYAVLARWYAQAFAAHHAVAADLAWMGSDRPGGRSWDDGLVAGLGVFLRGTDAQGREHLLALRSGGAWAHHHHDEGSLIWYAAGRSLVTDAGASWAPPAPGRKGAAAGHSRWTPDGMAPVHALWRWNRGWIQASDLQAACPWAIAWVPLRLVAGHGRAPWFETAQPLPMTLRQQRAVVRLDEECWLVVDRFDACPGQVRVHVPAGAVGEGSAVTCDLGDGERLYVQALLPGVVPAVGPIEHPVGVPAATTVEVSVPAPARGIVPMLLAAGRLPGLCITCADGVAQVHRDGRAVRLAWDAAALQIDHPSGRLTIPWPSWPR